MNEKVLMEAINLTGQQLTQALIDKNIVMAEMMILRQENAELKSKLTQLTEITDTVDSTNLK